jgi:hypothetical protein
MILTTIHIFLSVFGKTLFFCSSTKFAELSKPETPNIEAAKPRNIALLILPPLAGKLQLSINTRAPFVSRKEHDKAA